MSLTMSGKWLEKYNELQSFIRSNSRLEIGEKDTYIPEDLRVAFFNLFDMVRFEAVKSGSTDMLTQSMELSHHYLNTESSLKSLLGLETIRLTPDLQAFINDPIAAISSLLSVGLFELLRGKLSVEGFNNLALEVMGNTYNRLYYPGYVRWVMLSAIAHLNPSEAYTVSLESLRTEQIAHWDNSPREVPKPERANRFDILGESFIPLLVPDLIVFSRVTGSYVAIVARAGIPTSPARQLCERQQWIAADISPDFKSTIMIYSSKRLDDLSLVADAGHICQPDQLLWIRDKNNSNMDLNAKLHGLMVHMKPKRGMFYLNFNECANKCTQAPNAETSSANGCSISGDENADGVEKINLDAEFDESKIPQILQKLVEMPGNEAAADSKIPDLRYE